MKTAAFEPQLDRFREAVAELVVNGAVVGHLATRVDRFWGWKRPFTFQDQVFILVTWSDGHRDWLQDEYPWGFLSDFESGVFYWEPDEDETVEYSVKWLAGASRDAAWVTYASDWWAGNDSYWL